MKLLFDQNISFRLVHKIISHYPGTKQVREVELENFSDMHIWEFAKKNDFTIVSFDADFYDIANTKGHPPKIIWLRVGNTTTHYLVKLFLHNVLIFEDFILNPENRDIACLEINFENFRLT